MAKNILVINVDIRETRVALIEGGIIAELHIERHNARGTLGNIYLGKVSRVLPGMQAAFIDIGQERAAFLHVEDLIRPDDFEAYLAGRKTGQSTADDEHTHGREPDESHASASSSRVGSPEGAEAVAFDAPSEGQADARQSEEPFELELDGADRSEDEADEAEGDEADGEDVDLLDLDEPDDSNEQDGAEDDDAMSAKAVSEADADSGASESLLDSDQGVDASAGDSGAGEGERETDDDQDVDEASAAEMAMDLPQVERSAGEAPLPGAPGAPLEGESEEDAARRAPRARSRRGSRGRRRSGSTADRIKPEVAAAAAAVEARPVIADDRGRGGRDRGGQGGRGRDPGRGPGPAKGRGVPAARDGRPDAGRPDARPQGRSDGRQGRTSSARGDRRSKADPLRVSKTTPIRDVVREGQEVIVQVSKEPIGTKGARVSSHISLPGRYVVYLPTVEHVGISKRIGSDKERGRLREAIDAMKPPTGGLIVRTLAEGLTKKSLKSDVGYLVRLWGEIAKKRETAARAPEVLYTELDLVLKTARDLFTDDIEEIVIDDREQYVHLKRFVEMFMPERADAIHLFEGDEPIFDEYGIEEEIGRGLLRKVPLTSGGHLIIDQAEALTAIDVNTGRFVGKGSKDLEDTILKTNLEAVEEIAYQLRFRNIGGLIILDLIDMERATNREKVRRRLEQLLAKDKAKTTLNRISELGLIEMTRKRTRESLGRLMNEPCFYCDGTGNLQSKQTVTYEILRQIKRDLQNLRGYSVVVNAHPAVVDLMKNEERLAVIEAERRYSRRIELVPRKEYHLEQFDLVGK